MAAADNVTEPRVLISLREEEMIPPNFPKVRGGRGNPVRVIAVAFLRPWSGNHHRWRLQKPLGAGLLASNLFFQKLSELRRPLLSLHNDVGYLTPQRLGGKKKKKKSEYGARAADFIPVNWLQYRENPASSLEHAFIRANKPELQEITP